ncbi:MAG: hypothetical protein KDJ88_16435 [Bauldia sp.]|nr:hypothetical protein [Bauldia sp.]
MTATTIRQDENLPEAYPDAPDTLTAAAAALDPDFIWQRIESYIAHRWTARAVGWKVEGSGEWEPPLTPATIVSTMYWRGDDWDEATLSPGPFGGLILPGCGPYSIVATVGDTENDPPAAVLEAFRRLAEYMAAKAGKPGARSERIQAGSISLSHTRDEAWMARAIQNSGAADLLRPYRRVQWAS